MPTPQNLTVELAHRIEEELEEAHVPLRPRHPFTRHYLTHVVHTDEHILAAVFGRHAQYEGFFGFAEGMLVATNQRIIFLDHRPGYTTMDEIAYENVSGVNLSSTMIYDSATLYTKVANYTLSFAHRASAQHFANYIESRMMTPTRKGVMSTASLPTPQGVILAPHALDFLQHKDVGVLSTVDQDGVVAGMVIYYAVIDTLIHFVTKEYTRKVSIMHRNPYVAFTVFSEPSLQLLQIQGIVERVFDAKRETQALHTLMQPRTYRDGSHTPPLLRLKESPLETYALIPTRYEYRDYRTL